jgi:hypothetical protein
MGALSENVIGEVPIVMKLNVGSERLDLVFTTHRIIVARVGKRGAGSVASLPLWAALSGGIDGLFRRRKESSKEKAAAILSPARILAADKDNFPISYEEIVSVELSRTETGRTEMIILTRNDKYSFTSPTTLDKVSELFRDKVGTRLLIRKVSK